MFPQPPQPPPPLSPAFPQLTPLCHAPLPATPRHPQRAARFLMSAQLPSGDWPQQTISGVFNRNCMITYANYRWGPRLRVEYWHCVLRA